MFASANAGADGGEADGIAWRNPARRSVKLMRLQDILGDGCGSDRAGAELNESTAGQGILRHDFPSSQLQQVIFRRDEFAAAEMMRRNYCIAEGGLVKRFSKENTGPQWDRSPESLALFQLWVLAARFTIAKSGRRARVLERHPRNCPPSKHCCRLWGLESPRIFRSGKGSPRWLGSFSLARAGAHSPSSPRATE